MFKMFKNNINLEGKTSPTSWLLWRVLGAEKGCWFAPFWC